MNKALTNKKAFLEVLKIIQNGRQAIIRQANVFLLETYWNVGEYLSWKILDSQWGKGVVSELAEWLQKNDPDLRGFSASNLWRMKQFFETYSSNEKLVTLSRVLSWSHYCTLMARCKSIDEHIFYCQSANKDHWSVRDLREQISQSVFERTVLADVKLSPAIKKLPQMLLVFSRIAISLIFPAFRNHIARKICKVLLLQIFVDFFLNLVEDSHLSEKKCLCRSACTIMSLTFSFSTVTFSALLRLN